VVTVAVIAVGVVAGSAVTFAGLRARASPFSGSFLEVGLGLAHFSQSSFAPCQLTGQICFAALDDEAGILGSVGGLRIAQHRLDQSA
jgi:hypothetical protein